MVAGPCVAHIFLVLHGSADSAVAKITTVTFDAGGEASV